MREKSNGLRSMASPEKVGGGAHDKHSHHKTVRNDYANNNNHHGGAGSSESAQDSKEDGNEAIPMVWPSKFVIGLTNKEKEEDFMAIKGSKLPQRPKKRAKTVQRTLNVSFYFSFSQLFYYFK